MDNYGKSDGDTIPGHLPQAWDQPGVVSIPVYSSLFLRWWLCDILGDDPLKGTIFLLELIDLVLKVHDLLVELAYSG